MTEATSPTGASADTKPPVAGLTPIDSRETVTIQIARKLLDYLLKGNLRPGDRLPSERRLADVLGVGRSVIREALKSLALLGLVAIRQGNGSFLRSTESDLLPQAIEWGLLLGAKKTNDLIEARCHIKVIIAGLAAERRDAAALEDLRTRLALMREAGGDAEAFVAADVAFHMRLAEAANNETLLHIMVSIRSLLRVWITHVMNNATDFAVSYNEHQAVYDAVVAGDPEAARAAMQAHVKLASGRLEKALVGERYR